MIYIQNKISNKNIISTFTETKFLSENQQLSCFFILSVAILGIHKHVIKNLNLELFQTRIQHTIHTNLHRFHIDRVMPVKTPYW